MQIVIVHDRTELLSYVRKRLWGCEMGTSSALIDVFTKGNRSQQNKVGIDLPQRHRWKERIKVSIWSETISTQRHHAVKTREPISTKIIPRQRPQPQQGHREPRKQTSCEHAGLWPESPTRKSTHSRPRSQPPTAFAPQPSSAPSPCPCTSIPGTHCTHPAQSSTRCSVRQCRS